MEAACSDADTSLLDRVLKMQIAITVSQSADLRDVTPLQLYCHVDSIVATTPSNHVYYFVGSAGKYRAIPRRAKR